MRKVLGIEKQEMLTGMFFLAPFMIGLTIFIIIPVIYTVYLSFVDYNSLRSMNNIHFAGLGNFINVLTDEAAMGSYLRSLEYSLVYVPAMIICSLLLAILLNMSFKLKTLSRTMIFMPYVANIAAVAIVWNVILNPYGGPVNTLLNAIGIANPPGWLLDTDTALPVAALIAVWENVTFQTIVYLAALQEVPVELMEAAGLEGAGALTRFRRITLPWISPTTFFLVVSTIIGSTQNFSSIFTLTGGGPGDATEVAAVSIYKSAFQFNKYSFASAQSLVLFAVLLIVTIIQWRGQKKWVHY